MRLFAIINVAGLFFYLSLLSNAHAYLDPGTGSIILQAILGGIAVSIATISMYYQRMKLFFLGRKKNKEESGQKTDQG